ncbi:MAG: YaiI/YqxD family protein, partial [Porticoccaceae bacterium]|nr:YaiI/YqxD family protein [Porticoccaceae bacterium]
SPRGERFTKENIKPRLNMRDFLETMRGSGLQTGGPPSLNQADRKAFADGLDRWLSKRKA